MTTQTAKSESGSIPYFTAEVRGRDQKEGEFRLVELANVPIDEILAEIPKTWGLEILKIYDSITKEVKWTKAEAAIKIDLQKKEDEKLKLKEKELKDLEQRLSSLKEDLDKKTKELNQKNEILRFQEEKNKKQEESILLLESELNEKKRKNEEDFLSLLEEHNAEWGKKLDKIKNLEKQYEKQLEDLNAEKLRLEELEKTLQQKAEIADVKLQPEDSIQLNRSENDKSEHANNVTKTNSKSKKNETQKSYVVRAIQNNEILTLDVQAENAQLILESIKEAKTFEHVIDINLKNGRRAVWVNKSLRDSLKKEGRI